MLHFGCEYTSDSIDVDVDSRIDNDPKRMRMRGEFF